ncbi:MAG TPA: signal peptidase I, partial [Nitriliruptorales bacterium]
PPGPHPIETWEGETVTAGTTFTARGGIGGRTTATLDRPATTPAADHTTIILDRPTPTPTQPAPILDQPLPGGPLAAPEMALLDPYDLMARPPAARRSWWRLVNGIVRLLTTLAMLVLVVTFTAVAAMPAIGARAMIVLSGSMEPLVSAGDAAIIRDVPVEDLRVGDVITYHGIGEDKRPTTHRIIGLVPLDSGLHFQTQGDANTSPDPNLAPASNVVGRYDGMIPYGGRALLLLSRPEAKIVLVALPALLILMGELRTLVSVIAARVDGRRSGERRRLVLAGLALLLAGAVGVTATAATMAVLTDTGAVDDNTFATSATF